jgi:hypothetical protein
MMYTYHQERWMRKRKISRTKRGRKKMRARPGQQSGYALMDEGMRAACDAVGTPYRLAKLLGVVPHSVLKWKSVPPHRILEVEKVTGVDRAILRPDLYERV